MEEDKATYEWRRSKLLINGFNTACTDITASYMQVGDESMSAIHFRTTAKGNLPHLYYIFRKLDPLGTELNKVACSVTEALLLIGLHMGKEGMKHIKYHKELGETVLCTLCG